MPTPASLPRDPASIAASGDVRGAILVAATRRFASKGFGATSVQAIADDVGSAKPSLLYWFKTKPALREAVLDALLDRWKDVLPGVLAAATSGEDRLDSTLRAVIGFFEDDPDRARLLLRESLDRPAALRARLRVQLAPWVAIVVDYVRRGQRYGEVRADVDAEAWVTHVVLLMVGCFATAGVADVALADAPDAAERRVAELVRMARTSLFPDALH